MREQGSNDQLGPCGKGDSSLYLNDLRSMTKELAIYPYRVMGASEGSQRIVRPEDFLMGSAML